MMNKLNLHQKNFSSHALKKINNMTTHVNKNATRTRPFTKNYDDVRKCNKHEIYLQEKENIKSPSYIYGKFIFNFSVIFLL